MRHFFLLFTFLMLFHNTMTSHPNDLIKQSCKKAAASDPNLSYNFCHSTLKSIPQTHNATTLQQLISLTLNLTIANATAIASTISDLLTEKRFDKYAKACLQDCLELYSDAVPNLREGVEAFEGGDYGKANIEISSAMDASTTCEDGFVEKKGEVCPLRKENHGFCQLNIISLAFINSLVSS